MNLSHTKTYKGVEKSELKWYLFEKKNAPDNPPTDLYKGKSSTTNAVSKWEAFAKARPLAFTAGAVLTLSIRVRSPRYQLIGKWMTICL